MTLFPRPIDRLVAGYNLVLAGLWAYGSGRFGVTGPVIAHLAALALPAVLDRLTARSKSQWLARSLREGYPLLLMVGFWTELGQLLPTLHSAMNDDLIAGLDLAVFGRHWNESWRAAMPHPWLRQVMDFSYLIYLPLIYVPVVAVGMTGRLPAVRDMVFRLMATYLTCYVAYLVFPVLGPRGSGVAVGPFGEGLFASVSEALRSRGDSLGTAFPSSHAAGAVTVAILAARWLRPWVAGLLSLQAVSVVCATVYTGNHYSIDAVAGALLAVAVQLAVVPVLIDALRDSPTRGPVPLLPRFDPGALETTTTGGHQ